LQIKSGDNEKNEENNPKINVIFEDSKDLNNKGLMLVGGGKDSYASLNLMNQLSIEFDIL
jgi:hypothetical protein